MKVNILKIAVLPLAVVLSCLSAAVGFIAGAIVTAGSLMAPGDQEGMMGAGPWAVLIFPVLNALFGFLAGLFLAGGYNFLSEFLGGIELELE